MKRPANWLRLAALGLVVTLVADATAPSAGRSQQVIAVPIAVTLAAVVLLCALTDGRRVARGIPWVLVPLGLIFLYEGSMAFALRAPALDVLESGPELRVGWFAVTLSVWFLLALAVSVAATALTTGIVLELARGATARDAIVPAAATARSTWPRVAGAMFIGWAGSMAILALGMPILMAAMAPAIVLVTGLAIAWNIATAAVLPIVVHLEGPFFQAFGTAMRLARSTWRSWIVPVLIHDAILGRIVFSHASAPGSHSTTTNASVNWQGGYPRESQWVTKLAEHAETVAHPIAVTGAAVALVALGIAVRLKVARACIAALPGDAGSTEARAN